MQNRLTFPRCTAACVKVFSNKLWSELSAAEVMRLFVLRVGDADKYIVYKYCGEVTIQFHDVEFYLKVKSHLIDKYPAFGLQQLTTCPPTGHDQPPAPQRITDQSGHDVSLVFTDEARTLVANDEGALAWTMTEFQDICKNTGTVQYMPTRSAYVSNPHVCTPVVRHVDCY